MIFAVGVGLRVVLFSGYGLGDDPNYFSAYYSIYEGGTWSEHIPYDFRFAFWGGVVTVLRLLGVTEWGWVGFVTLCSIVNMPLVYALARQEWGAEWGLLAMALLAVFPLDVMTSTLFAVDIPLATYSYTAFWLYRVAYRHGTSSVVGGVTAAVTSGIFLFLGYTAKQWGLLIGVLFAIESVTNLRERWRASAVCGGTLIALLGSYSWWQWKRFGDPLYDVHLVSAVAWFEPHTWANQLDNWKMLLLPNEYGGFFAGWYPHVLAVLAILFAFRVRTAGKWLLYCLLQIICLTSVPAHYENGRWVILVTHIFRYLCFVSIPLCLALTGYLRELIRWRRTPGLAFVALLLVWTTVQAVELSQPNRDSFGEQRRANALILSTFPDEVVWSDFGFLGRLMTFAPDRRGAARVHKVHAEEPVAQAGTLMNATDAVIVTGGARGPWYGCIRCALSAVALTPPPTWTLVTMYGAAEMGPYRREPLRIWRVSPVVPRVNELLAEHLDESGRFELLRKLLVEGDYAVAAEMGRRLVDQQMRPGGLLLYLTGLAWSRAGRPATARAYWGRALDDDLGLYESRQIILGIIASGTLGDREVLPEWIERVRARFPSHPLDPAMTSVPPGFAEVKPLLLGAHYAEATAVLRALRDRKDETPERRRRAHYFLALWLLRAPGMVEAGAGEADAYRRLYGDDELAVELKYREGEARLGLDVGRARALLTEVIDLAPNSLWATEAHRRLTELDRTPPRDS